MGDLVNQLLTKRVIHIIPHDGIGGVEVAARSMLKSHRLNNNFKLLLIAGKSLSQNKTNVIESPFKSANNFLAYIRGIFIIYNKSPDVVVCSLWRSIPIGVAIKILRPRTKLVFFLHLASTVHFLDKYSQNLMLVFCDYIWADSQATLNTRIKENHYKTQVISFVTHKLKPNKITLERKISLSFVFWGRINRQKGLDRAIIFIKELASLGYHCKYDIWGRDDGEKDNLINLISTLGLADLVAFKGVANYSDLEDIATNYNFYLQLSRDEGMAMSVVESMQLGLIPIVTPVGEIANYCKNKQNSLVIYDFESFEKEVKYLISIINNKKIIEGIRSEAITTWENKSLYSNDFIFSVNKILTTGD